MSTRRQVNKTARRVPIHRSNRGFALATLLVIVTIGSAFGQAAPSPVKLEGPARLSLDPLCSGNNVTNFQTFVRNDGSTFVALALSVDEPTNKMVGKVALIATAIEPIDDKGIASSTPLEKDETRRVRMSVKGNLDPGEWDVVVRNNGIPIGTVTLTQPPLKYAVKIDTAIPDSPELSLVRGETATIPLKNDDGIGYLVTASFSVRGVVQSAAHDLLLPPGGGGELQLKPREEWFVQAPRTYFKDDVADGRLILNFSSPECTKTVAHTQMIKVKTTLASWSLDRRELWAWLTLLAVLIAGSLCSLSLNFFLPGNARRIRARTKLSLIAQRIDDITLETDPRVRSSLSVDQRQLKDRLERVKFGGQFNAEMAQIERLLDRLETRLGLQKQLQLVLNRYWRQRAVIVSDDVEDLRNQIGTLLRQTDPPDNDIVSMQAIIKKIDEKVANTGASNPEFAERLAKQVGMLQAAFDPQANAGRSTLWTRMGPKFADEWTLVSQHPAVADKIDPTDYLRISQSVFVLEQVRAFIALCEPAAGAALPQDDERRLELLTGHLRAGSWDRLKRAERLVRQVRQGIYYQQVDEAISNGNVVIEPGRPIIRQFEPTELRITFLDRQVNASTAREEYTCNWEIEYASRKVNLTSGGWSLSHSFPFVTTPDIHQEPEGRLAKWLAKAAGKTNAVDPAPAGVAFQVRVTFSREDGVKVPGMAMGSVEVFPPLPVKIRASAWNEFLQLTLALGVAVIGLVVGAREQILKLDVFPALVAIFLLGFASDRIKNVFAQSDPAAEDAANKLASTTPTVPTAK